MHLEVQKVILSKMNIANEDFPVHQHIESSSISSNSKQIRIGPKPVLQLREEGTTFPYRVRVVLLPVWSS
jgi:hypothetical protein